MNLLKFLSKKSKSFLVLLLILGIANSIFHSGLLLVVNSIVNKTPLPFFTDFKGTIFISIVVASFFISKLFQSNMISITQSILFDFELLMLEKLRFTSYESFENLGKERVYTSISDIRILGGGPEQFINAFNNSLIIICGLCYLFWISFWGGLSILFLMIILLIIYLIRNKKAEKDLNRLRDLHNHYYRYLTDLLQGFKEIKLSIPKNESIFYKFLKENRDSSKRIGIETAKKFMNNELAGSYSWYVIIGLIVFILPKTFVFDETQIVSSVITIFYLMGPVANLISFIPYYTNVKIAMERMKSLEKDIESSSSSIKYGDLTELNKVFESLRFENVVYEYFDAKSQRTFTLGPINMEVKKGEIIFVTGGNGSGKSTFVKILTGLYKPKKGQIFLNGQKISYENYNYYSNQFSAIFSDNHFFSENYNGYDLNDLNGNLKSLTELMKLEGIVKVNNENKLDHNLSKGQQKRLAMIFALLDNRQIFILDEWAAEQDPEFRSYFYRVLIPELKSLGKTLIAVTHDDAYFALAERTIKLDYGKIVHDCS